MAFFLSIITPAYNESANLPTLYRELLSVLEAVSMEWEWIIVDDHSNDNTFGVAAGLAEIDKHISVIRFSRNFGSHIALTCGINHAKGDCAVIMAADLQDPPQEIPGLLNEWRNGAQIVWAVRTWQEGSKSLIDKQLSRLYSTLMRRMSALQTMPPEGADFFLMDRVVIDSFNRFRESNITIFGLITWMGFHQTSIAYTKQARLHGSSGWNLKKKLKLVVDSVTSFTYLPIRLMSYIGFFTALLGFLYAGIVIVNRVRQVPVPGWSSLMVVVLVIGGIQIAMLGVLGEYLWRALEQSRNRPQYIVEAVAGDKKRRQEAQRE